MILTPVKTTWRKASHAGRNWGKRLNDAGEDGVGEKFPPAYKAVDEERIEESKRLRKKERN